METYHRLSDATLDILISELEVTLDEIANPAYDVDYHVRLLFRPQENAKLTSQQSGVLTIKLGDRGTYVINKQPPNKQIWLSSPIRHGFYVSIAPYLTLLFSGPKRFDYCEADGTWRYARDNQSMADGESRR
jgi:frataxin